MTNHDNWKELAADQKLTIDALAAKVQALEQTVESEHMRFIAAHEMYVREHERKTNEARQRATLARNLEDAHARLREVDREVEPVPGAMADDSWECPGCACALSPDWGWCPCCGARIAWEVVA